ncbi:MAG: exodeoxyribonuclease VII small subunit [Saccharofermentans sp.]|nr:exodeoxyribonuclease VII small subunit [Mageeibacillus sp.]MCI1264625.1 exodeoxyribonuclease VII small subunit [Saccharofermentans sp.]MCI1275180.1 exodeoxyribonuclease VII small subunit [Saccharofermentans sp.]MCI1769655.1 exodeoxyribonuclease VII small subunit [Mageeibacillus sp.]MCI2044210.1 exodeoxyribonuclease VII small subunit [Mageeibacillus sp.]
MEDEQMTYESAIAELKQLINTLNEGRTTLDESIKLYSRGIELASFCDKRLKEVEQKISAVNSESGEDILNISKEDV